MKVAVIGAGAAGLIAIKHAIDFGSEVTAFEQTEDVGGTWNYTSQIGRNWHGLDVHSSMYNDLVTNLPIELMCYPNEPYPDNELSFVSSDVVHKYYKTFADKYNLRDYINFEHQIVQVRPVFGDTWMVMVRDLKNASIKSLEFDAILVCNGHFHSPSIPNYPGRANSKARQMHSHDYKSPAMLKDETVLVIGGNFSAVDVVQQSASFAKSITWSHHLKDLPDLEAFGDNVTQKPDVLRFTEDEVEFVDQSTEEFTLIVYCTGYDYKFPFLSVDCGISTHDDYVTPLFKHTLNINRPSMGFIGVPNLICPNQLFCLQSRFCLMFMTGRKALPSKTEMMKDHEEDLTERRARGLSKKKTHLMGPDIQDQFYVDLATAADIEPIMPVIPRMHKFTNINRNQDFIKFRRKKFTIIDRETFVTKSI